MNANGHKEKAGEIENSLNEFLPDPEGKHVVAIVELTYGVLLHWIAFGMERKFGRHMDTHVGLPRELRRAGERSIAEAFENIDTFRAGRWYGSKGNGDIVNKCVEAIELINPFSFVFVNLKSLKQIEPDFLWNVFREGIIVWGKPEKLMGKKTHPSLKPLVIVNYSVNTLSKADKRKLLRKLYTSKKSLLDKKTNRLGPGIVLINPKKFEEIKKLFDELHVEYSLKKVWGH